VSRVVERFQALDDRAAVGVGQRAQRIDPLTLNRTLLDHDEVLAGRTEVIEHLPDGVGRHVDCGLAVGIGHQGWLLCFQHTVRADYCPGGRYVAVFFAAVSISSAVSNTVTFAVAVPAALTVKVSAAAETLSGASAMMNRSVSPKA
jgi:hypothetical protein